MSTKRTVIRVDIAIDQQWAVGAAPDLFFRPEGPDTADDDRTARLGVQKSPDGKLILPATSLVGSLFSHLVDAFDKSYAEAWLGGRIKDAEQGSSSPPAPSSVRCLATFVHGKDGAAPSIETLTTTAIDPRRRAAAPNMLRREEVVEPASVTWWLEWDHGQPHLLLDDLLTGLATWRPIIGRRRTADRGRAHVTRVFHKTVDLSSPEGLTWWLADRHDLDVGSSDPLPPAAWTHTPGTSASTGRVIKTVPFTVADALFVGGGTIVMDEGGHQVQVSRDVVPSTSWRGIFRHRVAHILRVTTEGSAADVEKLILETQDRLFGTARSKGPSDTGGHRGRLRFATSRLSKELEERKHVAIDRITGGAQDSLLYTYRYYPAGTSVLLTIYDDGPTDKPLNDQDMWLLEQVIRDLADGIIGIGGLTSRGYGTLQREEAHS